VTSNTALNEWVNEALDRIAATHPWWWLRAVQTTTPTTNPVTLPADYQRTLRVTVGGVIAHRVLDATINTAGSLYRWSIANDGLSVSPLNQEVKHWYLRSERNLTADADEPYLPDQWADVVVAWAAHKANLAVNRVGEANNWLAEYQAGVTAMRRSETGGVEVENVYDAGPQLL
jgi:hypothetical protein